MFRIVILAFAAFFALAYAGAVSELFSIDAQIVRAAIP